LRAALEIVPPLGPIVDFGVRGAIRHGGHHVDQGPIIISFGHLAPYPAGTSEVVREAVPQHQRGHRGDRDDRGPASSACW
jgi:hypothetical protein